MLGLENYVTNFNMTKTDTAPPPLPWAPATSGRAASAGQLGNEKSSPQPSWLGAAELGHLTGLTGRKLEGMTSGGHERHERDQFAHAGAGFIVGAALASFTGFEGIFWGGALGIVGGLAYWRYIGSKISNRN